MALAENIRGLREGMGLSKETLASRCGVSIRTVMEWEASRLKPGEANLQLLSKIFSVPIGSLEGRDEDRVKHYVYTDLIGCYATIDFGPYAPGRLEGSKAESVIISENERFLLTSSNFKLTMADKSVIVSITADIGSERPQGAIEESGGLDFFDYFIDRSCRVVLKLGYGQNSPPSFKGTVIDFSPMAIRLKSKNEATVIQTARLARISQI